MIFRLLLIYIITLPVMKTPYLPFLRYRIQFSEVIFLFLFFLWINVLLKNRRLPQDTGLNKPFPIFLIFCILSFFNSANLFVSTVEILGLVYLFIMLVLTVSIVDNKQKLDTVIKVWIAALTAVLVLGFIGWCISIFSGERNFLCNVYHGTFPYFKERVIYRVYSTFRRAGGLANYLIASLGFVASELLLTENKKYKIFLKIIIFSMCLMMIINISRSMVGFILSLFLIYNYFYKRKNLRFKIIRFLAIFFIIIIFLAITVFSSSFYIRSYKIENLAKETHKELAVNIEYAYYSKLCFKIAALEMVKRHPFLGVGLAMFPSYLERLSNEDYFYSKGLVPIYSYDFKDPYLKSLPPRDPHNDVLQYFAETGILGGGAFIFFIAIFLYLMSINMRKSQDNHYLKVRLFCFFASFIGILIDSINVDVFKARHVWLLMAASLALIKMHQDSS